MDWIHSYIDNDIENDSGEHTSPKPWVRPAEEIEDNDIGEYQNGHHTSPKPWVRPAEEDRR
jgi:hypothetical protein